MSPRRRVVLDTDIGSDVDDALCLALALASPELELCGLTTIGNESYRRAEIAAKLLALAGRDVPVYAGCRVPLLGGRGFNWFGHEAGETLEPGEEPRVEAEHGVDALLRLSHEVEDLEVVAIGPMTNLAVALAKDPDFAGRVRELHIMGGHVRRAAYGGHVFRPGVDYNLCSDPHASYAVLRSGIPTRLVTADVTLQTWLTDAEVSGLATGGPFARVLAAEIAAWTPVQKRIFSELGCDTNDDNAAFLHDPLTLGCVYEPGFCQFEELEIETKIDERDVLHTIERAEASDETFPMRCATGVDAKRFRAHFAERVTSLA